MISDMYNKTMGLSNSGADLELLKKLQSIELSILDEFVRICELHNLTYYLSFGTLLGAVIVRDCGVS